MPRKKRQPKKQEQPPKLKLDVTRLPTHNDISWIDYAWLGLGNINEIQISNPLTNLNDIEKENPGLREVGLMRNRHYLSFACKTLLSMDGIHPLDLLPIQSAILEEFWIRPFPLFTASRGFGKLEHPENKIRVQSGWKKMKDIKIGDSIYGGDGKLCRVLYKTYLQTNVDMYKIKFRDGREIEVCGDHQWKVWYKNNNRGKNKDIWSIVDTKTMFDKYYYDRIDSKSNIEGKICKEYLYAIPVCGEISEDIEKEYILHPYVVGVLLGDGYLNGTNIRITSNDIDILEKFESLLPKGYYLKHISRYDYTIKRESKNFLPFKSLCIEAGIYGYLAHNKHIPDLYKYGSYEQRLEIIKGLNDTDGTSTKNVIEFYTTSKQLADDYLDIARSLGICCNCTIKPSYIKEKRYRDCYRIRLFTDKAVFSLNRKLTYLNHTKSKAGISKYNKCFVTNIEYIGKGEGYCIQVDSPDSTYITKDYIVTHNTTLMAIYATLRCALTPGIKIVGVGAGFRQSKLIFEKMEEIWNNSPVLRSICDNNSGPKRENDKCVMRMNENTATFLPIGCLSDNMMVTTKNGIRYINEVSDTDLVYGNNKMKDVGKFFDNGNRSCKRVVTKRGYAYEGTNNHMMRIVRDNKIIWCRTDEMVVGDYILIDRSKRWFTPTFDCSNNDAYVLGAMIGDGTWTNKYRLQITGKDHEILIPFERVFGKLPKAYDGLHHFISGKKLRQEWLDFWQMGVSYTLDKIIPQNMMSASKENIKYCLRGLFDTDGGIQVGEEKGGIQCSISFYNTSEKLIRQIQYLLLHFGIICSIDERTRKSPRTGNICNKGYTIRINGEDVLLFNKYIGFGLSRKQKLLDEYIQKKKRIRSINSNHVPIDKSILINISKRFIMGENLTPSSIFYKKSITFDFLEKYIKRCEEVGVPIDEIEQLKHLCNRNIYYDKIIKIEDIGEKHVYDINVPLDNEYCANGFYSHNSGEKIRGYRANIILADEMASLDPTIYEVVIAGFAAVEASPVRGVKEASRRKTLKELNLWSETQEQLYESRPRNQSIISGTATWNFNHFAKYFERYKSIIESKGDPKKLELILGEVPDGFNWKDYSIVRIPYELIPEGFMNDAVVARAKATAGTDAFLREYSACHTDDSNGFFRRSLIESCVTSDMSPIEFPSGLVWFDPMIKGNPSKKYVYGIDPSIGSAMADKETDNFTISILELHDDHTRIVYLWSTSRSEFRRRLNTGILKEQQFYAFCARKIRDLMKTFPCCHIAMDAQGGGVLLYEALNDENNMEAGEQKIWEVIEDGKEKETDSRSGLHILEMCQFARYDWLKEANYGMHKDFSDKTLLFPRYDVISLGLAAEEDGIRLADIQKKNPGKNVVLLDTYEDCVMEIEELKDELASIVVTVVGSGVNVRERWDTPEIKTAAGKKGRMRKDRYSALLMANAAARKMQRVAPALEYNIVGGRVGIISGSGDEGPLYFGPDWYTQGLTSDIGVVRKNEEW